MDRFIIRKPETKPIKEREVSSAEIEEQTKAFLIGGGKIKKGKRFTPADNRQAFAQDGLI